MVQDSTRLVFAEDNLRLILSDKEPVKDESKTSFWFQGNFIFSQIHWKEVVFG